MALRYGVGLQHMGNLIGNMAQQSREDRMLNEANVREDEWRQQQFGLQEQQFQEAQRAATAREGLQTKGQSLDVLKTALEYAPTDSPINPALVGMATGISPGMEGMFERREAGPLPGFVGPTSQQYPPPMTQAGHYLQPDVQEQVALAGLDIQRERLGLQRDQFGQTGEYNDRMLALQRDRFTDDQGKWQGTLGQQKELGILDTLVRAQTALSNQYASAMQQFLKQEPLELQSVITPDEQAQIDEYLARLAEFGNQINTRFTSMNQGSGLVTNDPLTP
jgi:hypothetical protein